MVCQIVVLFDLDQALPLGEPNLSETELSLDLARLKAALTFLLLQGQNGQLQEGQNVPWISLRTYSSTGKKLKPRVSL